MVASSTTRLGDLRANTARDIDVAVTSTRQQRPPPTPTPTPTPTTNPTPPATAHRKLPLFPPAMSGTFRARRPASPPPGLSHPAPSQRFPLVRDNYLDA